MAKNPDEYRRNPPRTAGHFGRFTMSLFVCFFVCLLLWFLPARLSAQHVEETGGALRQSSGKDATRTESSGSDHLFLWEIVTSGEKSYICGSVHLMSENQFPLPGEIERAFEQSNTLVVEIDIMKEADIIQNPSLAAGMYYEGKFLQDVLPADVLEKTETICRELGIPLVMLSSFKPWVVATTIVQARMQQLGYSAELGLDLYFLKKAYEEGKNVEELETALAQLEMMNSIPENLQIAMLKDSLGNMKSFSKEIERMFRAWMEGDVREMESILEESGLDADQNEAINDILLRERNVSMAEKIVELMETGGNYFIIVGAGHLAGPGNIRDKLANRGYPCKQMTRAEPVPTN